LSTHASVCARVDVKRRNRLGVKQGCSWQIRLRKSQGVITNEASSERLATKSACRFVVCADEKIPGRIVDSRLGMASPRFNVVQLVPRDNIRSEVVHQAA